MSKINIIICIIGMAVGAYTFIKHLNGFNRGKTSAVDAWLVAVGFMGWSLVLYGSLYYDMSSRTMGYILFLVYWVGDNLKIQHHCFRYRRKLLKKRMQK